MRPGHEVAAPIVDAVLKGYNGTVFAYGQTGTGKTHTLGARGYDDPAVRGIMPRAVEQIMQERDTRKAGGMTVTVQYLQIYQDNVFDLLATGPASPGRARTPGGGGGGGGGVDVAEPLNLSEEAGGEIRVAGAREVGLSASACVWCIPKQTASKDQQNTGDHKTDWIKIEWIMPATSLTAFSTLAS